VGTLPEIHPVEGGALSVCSRFTLRGTGRRRRTGSESLVNAIGIGLIGVGRHGRRYAQHILRDVPGLSLAGFARRDPVERDRLASELGTPGFADYRDLIAAPGVDAIVATVPPGLHREIVERAAGAGKPILLEKPAAVTLEEGNHMLAAVRAAGVPVLVAQTLRFNEVVRLLLAERDSVGEIHAVRVSQRFEPSPTPWIYDTDAARAGTMLHTGIHGFDLLRVLSGKEGEEVTALTTTVDRGPFEDNFNAQVRFRGGRALGTVAGCRATAARSGAVEITGTTGMLVAEYAHRLAWRIRGSAIEPLELPPPVSTIAAVLEAFERGIRGGDPMSVPLEEGLRSLALVDAAYASAASGKAERVREIPS
jgi:predicted dehydrogenase